VSRRTARRPPARDALLLSAPHERDHRTDDELLHDPSRPVDPGDVFFTVVGDWGDSSGGEANVASLQDAADPQIIMTVGDNVYPNGTQSEWDTNALPYYQSPMQRIPFFPALGNHDVNSVGPANWADAGRPPVHAEGRERQLAGDAGRPSAPRDARPRHAERDDRPVRRGDVPGPVSGVHLHRVGKHAPLPLTPSTVDSHIRFA
jgi:hypothetical protein